MPNPGAHRPRLLRPSAAHTRALLERTVRQMWPADQVRTDPDGSFEFRFGCAAGWLTVLDTAPIMVRVTAHAAYDIDACESLWSELNDIQLATLSAAVAWCDGTVFVTQTLDPAGVNVTTLAQAVRAVGGVADNIGPLLAGVFDGQTPYASDPSSERKAG